MKLYGWYSLNAYNLSHKEYVYYNDYGQETFCTLITKDKNFPLNDKDDYIFCGEIVTFVM